MNLYKQRGFSLVELMVSITLGLILLAGVLSIFLSSRVTFSTNERQARLTFGRRDIRVAREASSTTTTSPRRPACCGTT
jgi:prepilin-type N-terminal cleavage/methylation domain-containing protein